MPFNSGFGFGCGCCTDCTMDPDDVFYAWFIPDHGPSFSGYQCPIGPFELRYNSSLESWVGSVEAPMDLCNFYGPYSIQDIAYVNEHYYQQLNDPGNYTTFTVGDITSRGLKEYTYQVDLCDGLGYRIAYTPTYEQYKSYGTIDLDLKIERCGRSGFMSGIWSGCPESRLTGDPSTLYEPYLIEKGDKSSVMKIGVCIHREKLLYGMGMLAGQPTGIDVYYAYISYWICTVYHRYVLFWLTGSSVIRYYITDNQNTGFELVDSSKVMTGINPYPGQDLPLTGNMVINANPRFFWGKFVYPTQSGYNLQKWTVNPCSNIMLNTVKDYPIDPNTTLDTPETDIVRIYPTADEWWFPRIVVSKKDSIREITGKQYCQYIMPYGIDSTTEVGFDSWVRT